MIDIKRAAEKIQERVRTNCETFAALPSDVSESLKGEVERLRSKAYEQTKHLPVLRKIESLKVERDNYKEAADNLFKVVKDQAEDINFRNASWRDSGLDPETVKSHLTHGPGGGLVSRASMDQYIGPPVGFIGLDQWEHPETGERYDKIDDWNPWETTYELINASDGSSESRLYEPVKTKKRKKPEWAYDTYGPQLVQEINKASDEGLSYSEKRQQESTHEKGWMVGNDIHGRKHKDIVENSRERFDRERDYFDPKDDDLVIPTGLNYENEEDDPLVSDSTWQKIKKLFGGK